MILDRPRSRRRRFLWPLVLTLVVLAALILARINDQAIAAVNYLDSIRQSSNSLVAAAASFSTLADRLATIERAEFQTVTDSALAALAGAARTVEVAPDSRALAGVASLYRLTVKTWVQGVQTFAEGVIRSADEGGSGEEMIYAGLQQVAAGDELYRGFIEELARPDVPDPIGAMPEVRMLPSTISPVALARLFAVAAGAANSLLALRADLAVGQVTADPEWVTDPSGNLVVSAAELMTIDVVVANHGNTEAPTQLLNLELLSADGAENRSAEVPELAPGGQTTVRIEGLNVAPGHTYQLSVGLQLTVSDGDAANNSITLSFLVNEPTA